MNLIECKTLAEVPERDDIEGYVILSHQTIEDVYAEYEKKFGVKPIQGWTYRHFVYLVKPEKK
jgi:hypothetical protein